MSVVVDSEIMSSTTSSSVSHTVPTPTTPIAPANSNPPSTTAPTPQITPPTPVIISASPKKQSQSSRKRAKFAPGIGQKARKERPCDACRRRKSRCVTNDGADKCVLCQFHSQECTFLQSPQPRKRPLRDAGSTNSDGGGGNVKKRSRNGSPTSPGSSANPIRDVPPITDYSAHPDNSLAATLGLQGNRHSYLIGPTAEYEPSLIDLCPFNSKDEYGSPNQSRQTLFRRVCDETTFTLHPDDPTANNGDIYEDCDKIERIVAPHGEKLITLYFRVVHPSFPILQRRLFLEKYARTHREFSPPLLAAVYILALHWWTQDCELAALQKPDVAALDKLASKTMADAVHRPKLSTVQAGLLLLQRNEEMKGASWPFTAQIVAIGQELGLHLDCTDWKVPQWEKGLRKRLAWGLYMQDKWGALTHGRPSHISKSNWAVRPVDRVDFPDLTLTPVDNGIKLEDVEMAMDQVGFDFGGGDDRDDSQIIKTGRTVFEQMIQLSGLMADILETFFTVESQSILSGRNGTQKVLERAKPIQIRLKEWFAKLPDCLRMDASRNQLMYSSGCLHLAYFATEITLHRQIIRTLSTPSHVDPYLLHICRSAAKTRLISAMDFVNRLKPDHLQTFWYFASKVNVALIGTFGSLLWVTSPTEQEAEFYKARLDEYRWTIRVSSRNAPFMEFAVEVLDSSSSYMQPEQWSKRAKAREIKGYVSTVGSTEHLKLGMGIGHGNFNIDPPPPPPLLPPPPPMLLPPTLLSANLDLQHPHHHSGHLSPITSGSVSDDDQDGDGDSEYEHMMMMGIEGDFSAQACARTPGSASSSGGESESGGEESESDSEGRMLHTGGGVLSNKRPDRLLHGLDFFMIPNSMPYASGGE